MTTLKGYKSMSGVSKKGNKYDAYIFYCEDDFVPNDVVGKMCYEKFIDKTILSGEPYLGAQVHFRFDHKGYLAGVEVI